MGLILYEIVTLQYGYPGSDHHPRNNHSPCNNAPPGDLRTCKSAYGIEFGCDVCYVG